MELPVVFRQRGNLSSNNIPVIAREPKRSDGDRSNLLTGRHGGQIASSGTECPPRNDL
jgi:hypothetical protein